VFLYYLSDYGKSKPSSVDFSRKVWIKDPVFRLWRDALPRILDGNSYDVFVSIEENLNPNKPQNAVILFEGVETPGFCEIDKVYGRMELNITAMPTMKKESISVKFDLSDKTKQEKVFLRKIVFAFIDCLNGLLEFIPSRFF